MVDSEQEEEKNCHKTPEYETEEGIRNKILKDWNNEY